MSEEGTEKAVVKEEDIRYLKEQSSEFLKSGYFFAASEMFGRLLEFDPDDKSARIGALMADNKISDEGKLVPFLQDLYSDEEYEIKLARDKDEDHINEMCDRFFIEGYLSKEEIEDVYHFDLSYKSNVFSRKRQKEEILKKIEQDENLSWLRDKGFREIPEILKVYDKRIDEALESDKENVQRIKNDYQRHLYNAYGEVREQNKRAKEKREDDYQDLIRDYEDSEDIEKLRDLSFAFERLGPYKDAEKYVSLCDQKIEGLKKEAETRSFKKVIDNSLDQAKADLIKGKYSDAYDGFTQILARDPDNEDARIGILMSRAKVSEIEELFDHYKDLYSEEQRETLEACEEDTTHIEEMVEKYYLPEYLEKEDIREKYSYDRTYRSCLNCRRKQEKQFREEIDPDPVFLWLKKNGSQDIRNRIDDLYEEYALRVREAEKEDQKKIERIRNDYQRFLFKTYSSIKKLHKEALAGKEETYRQMVRSYELAVDERELKDLISRFEELGDFKESRRYLSLCLEKIEKIKEKEKSDLIDQDIETTLIAGRAYLSSGNEGLANQSFARVLSLDPDNARAYLGILMLETGTKDIDSLVRYYRELYNEDEKQVLEACEEDRDHIEAFCEKYQIPGYLDKDTIRKYYSFDRKYESVLKSRVEQRDQFDEEVKMNPLLAKIADGTDAEVLSFLQRVRDEYEARIVEAKRADEKQCNSIRHIYEIYLNESDKTVLRVYEQKLKEKNDADEALYQKNIEDFNKELSEEGLEELYRRFDPDYKDGPVYVRKLQDKIVALRKERQADSLRSLYENGTALLESGLFRQAKERFESYLNIDPNDEDVHLKLLMAEKEVSDIDALFSYYKGLYSDEITETREAVEEETEHIEEMCEKCFIPELFEKDEIRKHYEFERTYESVYDARLIQQQQIEDEIELDPLFAWLSKNGSDEIQDRIDDLLDTYDARVVQAKQNDDLSEETIEKDYRAFIRNADREVRSLYNELNREKNKRAKDALREKKEAERRAKEEAELEKRLKEEALRKEREEVERERIEAIKALRRKQEEAEIAIRAESRLKEEEKQRKRAEEEKIRLEREAFARSEKERKKEEKRKKAEERKLEKEPFKPNFAIVMAVVSLIVLAIVSYLYILAPGNKYKSANALLEQGDYDGAMAIFEELGDYKDSAFMVKETAYKKAEDLYQRNEKIEAAKIFNTLRFDDSEERTKLIKKQLIENAKTGDTILFGDYDQDGNYENGNELIEWIVLDAEEGKILVISKYAIEAQKFNSTSDETSWEYCSLRSWLNGRFPDNAFSRENPSDVLQTELINYRYPENEEDVDLDELLMEEYKTRDRLFLLSSEEVEMYFPEEDSRICGATDYSIENGVAADAENMCNWWLRSSGEERNNTAHIVRRNDGSIADSMYEITNGVRPAMWLKDYD